MKHYTSSLIAAPMLSVGVLFFSSSPADAQQHECASITYEVEVSHPCYQFLLRQRQEASNGPKSDARAPHCYIVRAREKTALMFRWGVGVDGPTTGWEFRKESNWKRDDRWPGFWVLEACTADLTISGQPFTICGEAGHTVIQPIYFAQIRDQKRVTACVAGLDHCS